ncbi:MAG TPA: hypothetical protein PKV06_11085 [bacterium]|nr:hypothetical protein [bacterium]HNB57502.1 hypothetical protein [bacterium]HNH30048.1 hypothetical protein [bacterium]HNH33944.1 hypothetical protein [bacterium]
MKKILILMFVLCADLFAQANTIPIVWARFSAPNTQITTISGTDSLFSNSFGGQIDSLHLVCGLPANDSLRVKITLQSGINNVWENVAVDFDSVVSVGTQQLKRVDLKFRAGNLTNASMRLKIRAYNTAAVTTANGVSTGAPDLSSVYWKVYTRLRP